MDCQILVKMGYHSIKANKKHSIKPKNNQNKNSEDFCEAEIGIGKQLTTQPELLF